MIYLCGSKPFRIIKRIVYFEVDWIEEKDHRIWRVFRAKDLPVLWTAIKYMNMERRENDRPEMKQIRIKVMNKYDGEFSDITGDFDADMALDADWKRT